MLTQIFPKCVFPRETSSSTSDSLKAAMAIASDLLQRHFQTLVEDNAQWRTLITDSIVWELPYAPAIGHPPRLSGRLEVVRHVTWFLKRGGKFPFLRHECPSHERSGSGSG